MIIIFIFIMTSTLSLFASDGPPSKESGAVSSLRYYSSLAAPLTSTPARRTSAPPDYLSLEMGRHDETRQSCCPSLKQCCCIGGTTALFVALTFYGAYKGALPF